MKIFRLTEMNMSVLVVLCLVMTLTNVQLGHSQCDVKINSKEIIFILQTAVVRVAAAVHHTLGPIIEEIRKDIATIKNDIDTLNENICKNDDCYTCGDTGGWRHAVYLNMTDPNTNCLSGWNMTTPRELVVELIAVVFPVTQCSSLSVEDHTVRCVVGSELTSMGYQRPSLHIIMKDNQQCSSAYVSGVALMYGSPQQHIWTFAVGAWENDTRHQVYNCPCDTTGVTSVPPFVGEYYFSESGYVYYKYRNNTDWYRFHSNDTLWDGRDCHSTSTCCSLHNPPYFTKTLSQTTTDDLELRMCLYGSPILAVELVELYSK